MHLCSLFVGFLCKQYWLKRLKLHLRMYLLCLELLSYSTNMLLILRMNV